MIAVIDASAVVDALSDRHQSDALLDSVAKADLHAPSLLDYEVASALRGLALGGQLSSARLTQAIDQFAELRVERHPQDPDLRPLLALQQNLTVYDAAYVVLAKAIRAPLITSDAKMLEAQRLGIQVQLFA